MGLAASAIWSRRTTPPSLWKPNPNYELVLHKSWCRHFKRRGNLKWTKDYVKVCSVELKALERWAAETVGGQITPCSACFDS